MAVGRGATDSLMSAHSRKELPQARQWCASLWFVWSHLGQSTPPSNIPQLWQNGASARFSEWHVAHSFREVDPGPKLSACCFAIMASGQYRHERHPPTYRRASAERTFGRFPTDPDDVLRGHGHGAERLEDVTGDSQHAYTAAASCPGLPRAKSWSLPLPHHDESGEVYSRASRMRSAENSEMFKPVLSASAASRTLVRERH